MQIGPEYRNSPPLEHHPGALERIFTLQEDVHSIVLAAVHQLVSVWRDELPRQVSQHVAIEPGGGQER